MGLPAGAGRTAGSIYLKRNRGPKETFSLLLLLHCTLTLCLGVNLFSAFQIDFRSVVICRGFKYFQQRRRPLKPVVAIHSIFLSLCLFVLFLPADLCFYYMCLYLSAVFSGEYAIGKYKTNSYIPNMKNSFVPKGLNYPSLRWDSSILSVWPVELSVSLAPGVIYF